MYQPLPRRLDYPGIWSYASKEQATSLAGREDTTSNESANRAGLGAPLPLVSIGINKIRYVCLDTTYRLENICPPSSTVQTSPKHIRETLRRFRSGIGDCCAA